MENCLQKWQNNPSVLENVKRFVLFLTVSSILTLWVRKLWSWGSLWAPQRAELQIAYLFELIHNNKWNVRSIGNEHMLTWSPSPRITQQLGAVENRTKRKPKTTQKGLWFIHQRAGYKSIPLLYCCVAWSMGNTNSICRKQKIWQITKSKWDVPSKTANKQRLQYWPWYDMPVILSLKKNKFSLLPEEIILILLNQNQTFITDGFEAHFRLPYRCLWFVTPFAFSVCIKQFCYWVLAKWDFVDPW